jgi:hypothetical protein
MIEKNSKDWITISQLAQLTGLNNRTIMSAIKRGMISPDCIARSEENCTQGISFLFDDVQTITAESKIATTPYYIHSHSAAEYWYNNLNLNRKDLYEIREKLEKYITTFNPEFITKNKDDLSDEKHMDSIMSYKEAVRIERVSKAKIAELELREKEGLLIKKTSYMTSYFLTGKKCETRY